MSRHRGHELCVSVSLFGSAIQRGPAARSALAITLSQKIRFDILQKDIRNGHSSGLPMNAGMLLRVKESQTILAENQFVPDRVTIIVQPGLELNNRSPKLTATDIFERLIMRPYLLASWFGLDGPSLFDEGAKDKLIEAWQLLDTNLVQHPIKPQPRKSGRTEMERVSLAGPLDITLSGDLTSIWPYLRLGEITHIGRGAVSGLGRYRLEY